MIGLNDWPVDKALRADEVVNWLQEIAAIHEVRISKLHYYFVDDSKILEVNRSHLNHDYYTDIITFGYSEGKVIEGEVYVSLDTVNSNAQKLNVDKDKELLRVVAHGLLHLIGFNDKTEQEKLEMRKEEDNCLILLPKKLKNK